MRNTPDDDEGYEIEGEVLAVTDKAILLKIDGHGQEWIPKSQILDGDDSPAKGEIIELTITTWIAEQKGFI